MPQMNITTWLQFALQQMSAESYLDGFARSDTNELIRRLKFGNNNATTLGLSDPDNNPVLPGKTRFTDLQAQQFVQRYQIRDHYANDATGFSATLLFDTATNSYTLAMRSTEYRDQALGGDWDRDGVLGADGDIALRGFAFGQLVSMERYFRDLKSSGKLPTNAALNVTGYSLSGHLATVFTELHANDTDIRFDHTYTFNGAGRGTVVAASMPGLSEAEYIRRMIADLDTRIQQFDPSGALLQSGATGNIYQDSRYVEALQATRSIFTTFGTDVIGPGATGGLPKNEGAFTKITQLNGHAVTGFDQEFVANSGVHAPATPILIEGQPILEGFDQQREVQYGNTHSLTLMIDSLALQDLFLKVDPTLPQAQIENIFKAASAQAADKTVLPLGPPPVAEGDTLEKALSALRKIFIIGAPDTQSSRQPGDFGNLTLRNGFYAHLQEVSDALTSAVYRIEPLVGQAAGTIVALAQQNGPDDTQGMAYRYALKELTPFVVRGVDSATSQALYTPHNESGELSLVNPETDVGELTPQYLIDRAAFLAKKLDDTLSNGNAFSVQFSGTHFKDQALAYEIGSTTLPLSQFLFGDGTNDVLVGSQFRTDHLYGGGGDDQLQGQGGSDYLEGNRGDDTLDGGRGADMMVGGSDNDTYLVDNVGETVTEYAYSGVDTVQSSVSFTLDAEIERLTLIGTAAINGIGNALDNTIIGNSANNILVGQGGNDRLEGGVGFDTYIYHTGDGMDRIEDSDGEGQILFDGRVLQGGVHRQGDTVGTYLSFDGRDTYVMSGTDLLVDGVLTVNENFQSGQFGIRLIEEGSYANGLPDQPFTFGDADNTFASGGAGINLVLHMAGGDDYVLAGRNHDQVFGEDGNDTLFGNSANDRLYGGIGNDTLVGDNDDLTVIDGNDLLEAGDGDDQLIGGWGNDLLYGDAGADVLYGDTTGKAQGRDSADDYLDGGAGNDELHGLAGNDVLYGGTGHDFLSGEEGDDAESGGDGDDVILAYTGNDMLSGDAGADKLYGDVGDDLLDGGSEHDELYGGDGNDTLFGEYDKRYAVATLV